MAAEPWSGERIEKRWAFSSYFPATKKNFEPSAGANERKYRLLAINLV